MRVRAAFGSTLASLSVLVIGWQLGAAAPAHLTGANGEAQQTPSQASAGSTPRQSTATQAPGVGPIRAASASPSPSASGTSGTFQGASASTPFGEVQVEVTVDAGRITEVTPVHLTDRDRRSERISAEAAPLLREEVLAAQSAQVDTISGATYTSEGYLTSLQSAIDEAGL